MYFQYYKFRFYNPSYILNLFLLYVLSNISKSFFLPNLNQKTFMVFNRLEKLKLSLIHIILSLSVKRVLEQTKKSKTKVQRTIEKNITIRTLILEWNRQYSLNL